MTLLETIREQWDAAELPAEILANLTLILLLLLFLFVMGQFEMLLATLEAVTVHGA